MSELLLLQLLTQLELNSLQVQSFDSQTSSQPQPAPFSYVPPGRNHLFVPGKQATLLVRSPFVKKPLLQTRTSQLRNH